MSEKDKSERNNSEPHISRRSYLFGAGATLGALGLLNSASQVRAETDFETITVPAGEQYSVRLGDDDVLENVLIDISATGANYDIQASGSNWTIRNVGITGHQSGGHTEPFRVRDTSSSGHSVIENVCLDVTVGDSNATGLYVYWNHAGHLEIDGMYLGNWTDNGVYASGPGNPSHHPSSGSNGTVAIKNTYSFNNDNANLRLGTDGSYCENCVMVDGTNRGFWGFYNHTELIDCDIVNSGSDIAISDSHWNDYAEVTARNSRWSTETAHGTQSTSQIYGTSQGTPQDRIPEGCPTSAEEAAGGEPSDSESPDESVPEPTFPADGHLVAFVTEPDASLAAYEFRANGPVEFAEAPYESPSGGSIVGGTYTAEDFIEEHDDHWHAGGITGGGYGDAFVVDGPITDVSLDQPDVMWIELNGEEVSEEELIERTGGESDDDDGYRRLELAGQFEYRVEVDGEIRPADDHAQWLTEGEAYGDDWAEWWLSGSSEARTVWEFTGEITDIQIDDYSGETEIRTLAVDGEELDHGASVEDDGPHTLEVAGQFEYRVEVDGEIEPLEAHARWLTEGEAFGDDWAEWWLSGSDEARTVWEFTGEITDIQIDDYDGVTDIRTLAVDGEQLDII